MVNGILFNMKDYISYDVLKDCSISGHGAGMAAAATTNPNGAGVESNPSHATVQTVGDSLGANLVNESVKAEKKMLQILLICYMVTG